MTVDRHYVKENIANQLSHFSAELNKSIYGCEC